MQESEELFLTAFQTSPIAYAIASPENGHHYDVNESWVALLGYSREEALENNAVRLGIWQDPEERKKFVGLLEEHGAARAFETKFCRKDGTIIDVAVSGEYVMFQDKPRLFNVYDDITKRKQAERLSEEQASSMKLMRSIADTANQSTNLIDALCTCLRQVCEHTGWDVGHVYMVDVENAGNLSSSNCWFVSDSTKFASFKQITRQQPHRSTDQGLCGRVLESGDLAWTADVQSIAGFWRAETAQKAGLQSGVALPMKIRNSIVAILEFYATDEIDQHDLLVDILDEASLQMGRVIERAANQADLIARRDQLEALVAERTAKIEHQSHELELALEKEKELNALQRQFVAMASHEFRTPLTIIDNTAQLLKRGADKVTPEMAIKRSERIREAVHRMTQLMDSTLSAVRMQDGNVEVKIHECDLANVINTVVLHQQEIARNHDIACDVSALPFSIQGDPEALTQVFTNLLSNAVKYAPDAPEICVTASVEGDDVLIAIKDSGIGIEADALSKVGERYFRANTSTGIAGTGIGLNLVKMLVEMHDGTMQVESTEGEGSTFTIRLPIDGPAEAVDTAGPVEAIRA